MVGAHLMKKKGGIMYDSFFNWFDSLFIKIWHLIFLSYFFSYENIGRLIYLRNSINLTWLFAMHV